MADQRKEYDPMRENIRGGAQNSEHELDVAGMRQSTKEGTMQVEKDRAAQGTLEKLSEKRKERGENPDPTTVSRPLTTSYSPMDERIEEKEGGKLLARTPEEMSFTEELSREPIKQHQKEHVDKDAAARDRA